MSASKGLYRAYLLRSDGHFYRAEVVQAASDEEALDQARGIDSAHGVELWDRGRFVGKVAPPVPTLGAELSGAALPGLWDVPA